MDEKIIVFDYSINHAREETQIQVNTGFWDSMDTEERDDYLTELILGEVRDNLIIHHNTIREE